MAPFEPIRSGVLVVSQPRHLLRPLGHMAAIQDQMDRLAPARPQLLEHRQRQPLQEVILLFHFAHFIKIRAL